MPPSFTTGGFSPPLVDLFPLTVAVTSTPLGSFAWSSPVLSLKLTRRVSGSPLLTTFSGRAVSTGATAGPGGTITRAFSHLLLVLMSQPAMRTENWAGPAFSGTCTSRLSDSFSNVTLSTRLPLHRMSGSNVFGQVDLLWMGARQCDAKPHVALGAIRFADHFALHDATL